MPIPAFDPDFGDILADRARDVITEDAIPQIRGVFDENLTAESVLSGRPILHKVNTIPGPGRRLFSPYSDPKDGRVRARDLASTRCTRVECFPETGSQGRTLWRTGSRNAMRCASAEYRLAPEHPDPATLGGLLRGAEIGVGESRDRSRETDGVWAVYGGHLGSWPGTAREGSEPAKYMRTASLLRGAGR